MSKRYYHGSAAADIQALEPRSLLHGTADRVIYLTDHVPYALLYIWDEQHNGRAGKYVTGWIKDGVAYYEEQFPNQLQTFYQGVQGYLYTVEAGGAVQLMAGRESLYYAKEQMPMSGVKVIPDVYAELLQYEAAGSFKVLRYLEQTAQRQNELINMIAEAIRRRVFYQDDANEMRFMKKHFPLSWQRAEQTNQ